MRAQSSLSVIAFTATMTVDRLMSTAPTAGPEYSAPESTVVYVNLYGTDYMYHSASSCSGSGMSGGTAETLEFALDLGYGRCPYCNPPSSIG